jgi:hypothetical protein
MTISPIVSAVNSLFKQLGTPAIYKNSTIRIILTAPDEIVGVGFVQAHSPSHQARIRIAETPNLKVGDKIMTESETLVVHSEPIKDIHRLIWSCDLICV